MRKLLRRIVSISCIGIALLTFEAAWFAGACRRRARPRVRPT